jgi:hypothetical protein
VAPDRLVDVADETFVLASLPHEAVDRGSLVPNALGGLDELVVRSRRALDPIAPKEQDPYVDVPRKRERLAADDHGFRGSRQEIAAKGGRRCDARKVGEPAGTREFGDPNGVDHEQVEVLCLSFERRQKKLMREVRRIGDRFRDDTGTGVRRFERAKQTVESGSSAERLVFQDDARAVVRLPHAATASDARKRHQRRQGLAPVHVRDPIITRRGLSTAGGQVPFQKSPPTPTWFKPIHARGTTRAREVRSFDPAVKKRTVPRMTPAPPTAKEIVEIVPAVFAELS